MRILTILIVTFFLPFTVTSQPLFDLNFHPKTLRMDFNHFGNADMERILFKEFQEESFWAGSRVNLIDTFRYGEYFVEMTDKSSDQVIYSRGFSSLFAEWRTLPEANFIENIFYEVIKLPFPMHPVRIIIYKRNREMVFEELFSIDYVPGETLTRREKVRNYPVKHLLQNGEPAQKVDVVFIPEGYTKKDKKKFRDDAKRFMNYIVNWVPYKNYKSKFNFSIIEAWSIDSGTDIPHEDTWKSTLLGSTFSTFGMNRYISITDIETMHDVASLVPHDQIIVLVNSDAYGGGGIYNFYTVCTSDNENAEFLVGHEFAHAFAALADEYEAPSLNYSGYYVKGKEPERPNITTLDNFGMKWKHMVHDTIPVPTPENEHYDNVVGVFEGALYQKEGVFRPFIDCSMRSALVDNFCPVCVKTIESFIQFNSK
ncbi:MAG: M64 family metallopeptidase [bacterium]